MTGQACGAKRTPPKQACFDNPLCAETVEKDLSTKLSALSAAIKRNETSQKEALKKVGKASQESAAAAKAFGEKLKAEKREGTLQREKWEKTVKESLMREITGEFSSFFKSTKSDFFTQNPTVEVMASVDSKLSSQGKALHLFEVRAFLSLLFFQRKK